MVIEILTNLAFIAPISNNVRFADTITIANICVDDTGIDTSALFASRIITITLSASITLWTFESFSTETISCSPAFDYMAIIFDTKFIHSWTSALTSKTRFLALNGDVFWTIISVFALFTVITCGMMFTSNTNTTTFIYAMFID